MLIPFHGMSQVFRTGAMRPAVAGIGPKSRRHSQGVSARPTLRGRLALRQLECQPPRSDGLREGGRVDEAEQVEALLTEQGRALVGALFPYDPAHRHGPGREGPPRSPGRPGAPPP